MDLATSNAWAEIVERQEREIKALHLALSFARGDKWAAQNMQDYWATVRAYNGEAPDYLVRAYGAWKGKCAD